MHIDSHTPPGPFPSGWSRAQQETFMKSSFPLYQALISIDVTEDRAAAVVDALESDMQTQLATKADIDKLESRLELKLTIRMAVMLTAAVGIMLTAFRFMH
ncbi:hypothetical protein ALP03_02393 [Pseudomonas amygdali pv. tabaci]|uniref:DUF1640 domain-containing protein n=1 Tax=Pseudomonas amygdali pv. tabaci TaxID=322 RepID=A0A3M6HEU7_PSEAJ|nr:hypothetical protein ALP03_02393 [Pseudomonas amygdali pv. tabaci]